MIRRINSATSIEVTSNLPLSAVRRGLLSKGLVLATGPAFISACSTPWSQVTPKIAAAPPVTVGVVAPPVARKRPRWALALGGGAARGFAHIGVLSVLAANGLRPDMVFGTSAGAVVGALYCAGVPLERIRVLAASLDETRLMDWSLFSRGVIKGRALQDQVNQWLNARKIEQFSIPFTAVTTDLYNGSPFLINSGDAGLAVRASSAVPGVFEPVKIGDREYVDGGLVAPIPVRLALAAGAQYVFAVDISAQPKYQSTDSIPQVMLQSFAILGQRLGEVELASANVSIRPEVGDLGSASFEARERSYLAGQQATRAVLFKLLADLR